MSIRLDENRAASAVTGSRRNLCTSEFNGQCVLPGPTLSEGVEPGIVRRSPGRALVDVHERFPERASQISLAEVCHAG
jgi:hypothetical protein